MNEMTRYLPIDVIEACEDFLKSKERRDSLAKRKDEFSSVQDWQLMLRKEDELQKASQDEVAKLMVAYGYAPRLNDSEETLANAREIVNIFLGIQ
jgi:hypothetical protein